MIPKANQHIYEPKSVTKIGWNSLHWVEIWCSNGFRVIACCDLDVWPFDLSSMIQVLTQTSDRPNFFVKFAQILTKTLHSHGFWSLLHVTLT